MTQVLTHLSTVSVNKKTGENMVQGSDEYSQIAFQQLFDKLKNELQYLPKEKTEKLFRHNSQFNKINFQRLKLLEYLTEIEPIERWNIFNEQLGVSMIDYILARPANLELIFINDVFHVRK